MNSSSEFESFRFNLANEFTQFASMYWLKNSSLINFKTLKHFQDQLKYLAVTVECELLKRISTHQICLSRSLKTMNWSICLKEDSFANRIIWIPDPHLIWLLKKNRYDEETLLNQSITYKHQNYSSKHDT